MVAKIDTAETKSSDADELHVDASVPGAAAVSRESEQEPMDSATELDVAPTDGQPEHDVPQPTAQHPTGQRPTLPRWPLALAALLFLLLLWIIATWLIQAQRVPSDDDLARAGRYIENNFSPGDALAISPAWALRGTQFVGDLKPVFDPHLVDHPPEAERLWVLAEPEGHVDIDDLGKKFQLTERKDFGRVQVALLRLGRQRGFHAVDHIAEAQVHIETQGSPVACDQWKNKRWSCRGRPDWQHIGVEALDVDLAPREVIWAHPPPAGEQLVLRFAAVQLGQSLDIMAGNTVHGAQFAKAAVQIALRIGDHDLGQHAFSGYPLQSWRIDTQAWAGQSQSLELRVSTRDNGANHFALDAVVVGRQLDGVQAPR